MTHIYSYRDSREASRAEEQIPPWPTANCCPN